MMEEVIDTKRREPLRRARARDQTDNTSGGFARSLASPVNASSLGGMPLRRNRGIELVGIHSKQGGSNTSDSTSRNNHVMSGSTVPTTIKEKLQTTSFLSIASRHNRAGLAMLLMLFMLATISFHKNGISDGVLKNSLKSNMNVIRMQKHEKQTNKRIWTEPPLTNFSLKELQDHPTLAPAKPLKVNYPIFVASFSKSGTTSVFTAFACYLGTDYVAHRWTSSARLNGHPELIGRCIQQNMQHGSAPFEGCGVNYFNRTQTVVWSDTGYVGREGCYNPNLQALDAIWEAYPQATLLLVRRNATAWYRSANTRRAMFIPKWRAACKDMPNENIESLWVEFYNNHTERIRQFAEKHKDQMTYVEIELENPNSGKILEEQIGLPASCWKNCPSSFNAQGCTELKDTREGGRKEEAKHSRRRLQEMELGNSFVFS